MSSPAEQRPEAQRGRRRWVVALLIVVAVLVLAEGAVRVLSPDLLPPDWGSGAGEVQHKYDQLAARQADGGTDLLVVGDSQIDGGIDPVAVGRAAGFSRPYNAALLGARLPAQGRWFFDHLLPQDRPRLVLQGMSPVLVSDLGSSPADVSAYETMLSENFRRLDPDAWQTGEQWLADQLYLVRYRSSLRSPRIVGQAISDRVTGTKTLPDIQRDAEHWDRAISPSGQDTDYRKGVLQAAGPKPLYEALAKLVQDPFRFEAYDTLLDAYQRAGVPVVVVIPPVALREMAANGVDVDRWRAASAEIASRAQARGLTVLDFTDADYPRDAFFDPLHLNGVGSARFSDELGAALDDACRATPTLPCRR